MAGSGILPADVPISLTEYWSFYDTANYDPAMTLASGSLSIVFTPVPEPATTAGLAVAGATLLARRRGRRPLKPRAV